MKKYLVAALVLLSGRAFATDPTTYAVPKRAPEPATLVTPVKSSMTVVAVTIASHTATSVVGDPTQMYRWVKVQNLDLGCSLYCSENSNSLSTTTVTGWVIPRSSGTPVNYQSETFDIVPGYDFYCQSGCINTTSRAIVRRGR